MSSDEGDFSQDEDHSVSADGLCRAAGLGKLEVVKRLVNKYGVKVNCCESGDCESDDEKWAPIIVASTNGHTDVVRFLIASGASVNKRKKTELRSPILSACRQGHRDVVELLLANGAELHDTDPIGRAPIHIACAEGHVQLMNLLLASGASVNDEDENGDTPLMASALHGQYELVLLLLDKGAKVDHCTKSKRSPLSMACVGGRNDIVLTLLTQGANANDFGLSYNSPLYAACEKGHNDVLLTLLAHGVQVRNRDFLDRNPLHPACLESNYKVVQTLLRNGVNTVGYDKEGLTPLHNAWVSMCRSEYIQDLGTSNTGYTVKLLLEYGIDPNVLDKGGCTPFERSCENLLPLFVLDEHRVTIMLDYGSGSGVACRGKKCACKTTALMCMYYYYRSRFIERVYYEDSDRYNQIMSIRNAYEKYFIRARTAGIYQCPEENPVEPPVQVVDWNLTRRAGYYAECEAELRRMESHSIGETSATYLNLLTRNLPALRGQGILGQLTGDGCVRRYPIYGNMIFSSYVRLRRIFLEEESPGFFTITSPPLPPECAAVVQQYLSNEDLANIVDVYSTYLLYLKKLQKLLNSEKT